MSTPTVFISPDQPVVTTIERFTVPAEQQTEVIAQSHQHIVTQWKQDETFVAAVLLQGRNGGFSCYAQWRTPVDGIVPHAPTQAQSLSSTLPHATLVDSRTYTVAFSNLVASATPPVQVSLDRTPNAHFGIFGVVPEKQEALLEQARANAPRSLTTPDLGLIAINFHRSVDGMQVINLGVWASLGNFNALLQRPGFRDDNQYWAGLADFRPDFFDVVAVEVGAR